VLGLGDIGLADVDVEETGATYAENAERKALAYAQASGLFALGDDSGLSVDALDGRPGLYSARYGDAGLDDRGRRLKLLTEMNGVPDEKRTARFVCVITVANPHTLTTVSVTGTCEGRIAHVDDEGQEGFGYDAIFIPDGFSMPFSRIGSEAKNRISHRGVAAHKLILVLEQLAREV
jgi:XTP/dITP diphosphohydrolase